METTTENKELPATAPTTVLLKRTYGKIVLTLENAIYSTNKLEEQTVSQIDGLSKEIEMDLRILGCELIQTAGILLKLPQVCDFREYSVAPCLWKLFRKYGEMFKNVLPSPARLKFNEDPCCRFRSPWRRDKCFFSGSSTPNPLYDTTSRRLRWAAFV